MDVRNYFVGIKNFKEVSTELLDDAISYTREDGAILFVEIKEDNDCVFIAGNIGAMICAIAELIVMTSKRSGFPISAIVKSILNNVYGLSNGEV